MRMCKVIETMIKLNIKWMLKKTISRVFLPLPYSAYQSSRTQKIFNIGDLAKVPK